MTDQAKVVTIDGKEYPLDNLKDDQRVLIDQVSLCQSKINELTALIRQIDIYEIAKKQYLTKLGTSLENDETLKRIENSQEE